MTVRIAITPMTILPTETSCCSVASGLMKGRYISKQKREAPAVATESIDDIAAASVAATSSPTTPDGSSLHCHDTTKPVPFSHHWRYQNKVFKMDICANMRVVPNHF
eukprot:COSAG02_NODE_1562_length_11922_cov_3.632411_3_plen_107_part_00